MGGADIPLCLSVPENRSLIGRPNRVYRYQAITDYRGRAVQAVLSFLGSGTTIPFIMQPVRTMPAQILTAVSKFPIEIACPPIKDPSEMPRKSALLFQASTVLRRVGKSFAKLVC